MDSNQTILYTIMGASLAALLYNNYKKNNVVENFIMYPQTIMKQTVQETPQGLEAVRMASYRVPTGVSSMNVRGGAMSNMNNMSSMSATNAADKYASLVFGSDAQEIVRADTMKQAAMKRGNTVEGFTSAGCRQNINLDLGNPPTINAGSNPMQSNYGGKGYEEVMTSMLPVQDMSGQFVNELGEEVTQPIVYDRYIYANQKSVVQAQGDFIRGDLPIVPDDTQWFASRYRNPVTDLRSGALAVLGGATNDTTRELLALQAASVGGILDVGSGVNYSVQKQSNLSASGSDISVTAFP